VLNERVLSAHLGAESVDTTFRHLKNLLTVIASQDALRHAAAQPDEQKSALQTGYSLINTCCKGIFLVDAAGRQRAAVSDLDVEIDWAGIGAIHRALSGRSFSISLHNGSRKQIILTVPVLDDVSNRPVAALAAVIDLSAPDISPFEHPFNLGKTAALDVVDIDGQILISSVPERLNTTSEHAALLKTLFEAGQPTVETCVGCSADNILSETEGQVVVFAPLTQVPWAVVIQQDSGQVFAPVAQLKLLTALLGMAAIVGALVLVWITTNSVVAPVQLLRDAALRIAGGDLTTPICCHREDEIGDLAENFDVMRQRLKTSINEIQAWNQELDARVQARTQEARAAQLEAQWARDDLRAIIDGLSDELIVIGPDYRIQQVNKAAQIRYAGNGSMIGRLCYEVFHYGQPCQSATCQCPIPVVLSTGKAVKVTQEISPPGNGQRHYVDIVASPNRDVQGQVTRIIELRRDVTQEKTMAESLVRRNQQLAILNTIATTVNQSLDLKEILGRTLDEVLRLTGIDVGAIFLQSDMLSSLELMAHRGLSEEAAHLASKMGMLDGSCGGVLEGGDIIVIPDLSRYRGRRAASLQREQLQTLVHVPLAAKGCILGSICVGTRTLREFAPEEQNLLTAIGSQIAVAVENARLYAEVQKKEQLRGELLRKVITAQEEERKRLARELHDDTSQALTALLFAAEETLEMSEITEMKERLDEMRRLSMHTLEDLYKLIFDLRPTMLDHLGLVPALRSFAEMRLGQTAVNVTITESSPPRRLPAEVETALFRIMQEVITNIARHSAARNAAILFHYSDTSIMVDVEDDGMGFDLVDMAVVSPDSKRGLGLMGMVERVELLGGHMEIDTAPGYGTQIHVEVPCRDRDILYG
jgi:signal transduction histidine kinase/HAMP domain-containing protein